MDKASFICFRRSLNNDIQEELKQIIKTHGITKVAKELDTNYQALQRYIKNPNVDFRYSFLIVLQIVYGIDIENIKENNVESIFKDLRMANNEKL